MLVAVMIMWYSEGSIYISIYKEGCVYPMVIWSEFRLGKYRDDDHREDAPHFSSLQMDYKGRI